MNDNERNYELVQSPRSAVLGYLSAIQLYVQAAYEMAKRTLKGVNDYSKGLAHIEKAIQSLQDAQGHVEEAMREIEG